MQLSLIAAIAVSRGYGEIGLRLAAVADMRLRVVDTFGDEVERQETGIDRGQHLEEDKLFAEGISRQQHSEVPPEDLPAAGAVPGSGMAVLPVVDKGYTVVAAAAAVDGIEDGRRIRWAGGAVPDSMRGKSSNPWFASVASLHNSLDAAAVVVGAASLTGSSWSMFYRDRPWRGAWMKMSSSGICQAEQIQRCWRRQHLAVDGHFRGNRLGSAVGPGGRSCSRP